MRILAIVILAMLAATEVPAQNPVSKTAQAATQTDETQQFQTARVNPIITERIAALKQFVADFPGSSRKTFALELISSSRAELGDQKLRLSDFDSGIRLFKLAVAEAPTPVSERLFAEILINLPTNLLFRGQSAASYDLASMIEEKVAGNPRQLLGLAGFYLGTENAGGASRLARKAIALDPTLPPAYQTLGMASRIDFDLDASEAAYAEALRLDPDSTVSKKSLAELKRATGKPADATALYREVLDKNPEDVAARTGLILSLFDEEKRPEAERELSASLEENPENLFLLVGAAYWYAAHNEGSKAVALAEQAVALEPRYTWAHIALARGLINQQKPLEAERTLLIARQYGNFPTLDYEIASARLAAGLFRESVDQLRMSFSFGDDGMLLTRLGGRVSKEGKSFTEILGDERRASIFQPLPADDPETAEKLRSLLKLSFTLEKGDGPAIGRAADEFVSGDDKMKTHRRLYAAQRLLEKRADAPKALELTEAARNSVDPALDVNVASAAVLADELYESRTLAASRNEYLVVPEVPRQTLSRILRGRIEDLTGWALFQQEKPDEAIARLKKAVSILPENSAWWRSSQWRLGDALDAGGMPQEALTAYVAGYDRQNPEPAKRIIVESIYKRLNGSTDGIEAFLGEKPATGDGTSEAIEDSGDSAVPAAVAQPVNTSSLPTRNPPVAVSRVPANVPIAKESGDLRNAQQGSAQIDNKDAPIVADGLPVKTAISAIVPEILPQAVPEQSVSAADPDRRESGPPKDDFGKNEPVADKTGDKSNSLLKPLFEPIIISIPKESSAKPVTSNDVNTDAASTEPAAAAQPVLEDSAENAKPTETKTAEVQPEKTDRSLTMRPRLVSNNPAAVTGEKAPCRLIFSPESLSLLNDGGSLGVFVGFEGEGDLTKIIAVSGSATDLSVVQLSDVGVLTERIFFIIKSISPKPGDYSVMFDSPCGTKDLPVTVR